MTSAAAVQITGLIPDEALSVCTWVFGDNGEGHRSSFTQKFLSQGLMPGEPRIVVACMLKSVSASHYHHTLIVFSSW